MSHIPMADQDMQSDFSALYLAMSVFFSGEPTINAMNAFSKFVDILIYGKQVHMSLYWKEIMQAKAIMDEKWAKVPNSGARIVIPDEATICFFIFKFSKKSQRCVQKSVL